MVYRIHMALFLSLSLVGCVLDTKVVDNPGGSSTGATEADDTGASTGGATEGGSDASGEPGTISATVSSGDPTATAGEPAPVEPCIEVSAPLAFDEPSPGGFSAAELLADKLGPRTSTLKFADEPLTLSDAWKGEELPFTIELVYMGGPVEWIDSEFNPEYEGFGDGPGVECDDRMNVGVQVVFSTEQGEFDEDRPAVLEALTVERATTSVDLFETPPAGSFDVTTLYGDPEWVSVDLDLAGTWEGALAGGNLFNEVQVGGDDGFIGAGTIAWWGDEIL
jgi:hypothetical protein